MEHMPWRYKQRLFVARREESLFPGFEAVNLPFESAQSTKQGERLCDRRRLCSPRFWAAGGIAAS